MAGDRVDRPEAREGLARNLAEVLPGHEDVGRLPIRDSVREADHEALREDEVEPTVRSVGDLRERLPHAHDVERPDAEKPAQSPRLNRGRVVRNRFEREVGRNEVEPLAGHEVARDGTVEAAAQKEYAFLCNLRSPRPWSRPSGPRPPFSPPESGRVHRGKS